LKADSSHRAADVDDDDAKMSLFTQVCSPVGCGNRKPHFQPSDIDVRCQGEGGPT